MEMVTQQEVEHLGIVIMETLRVQVAVEQTVPYN